RIFANPVKNSLPFTLRKSEEHDSESYYQAVMIDENCIIALRARYIELFDDPSQEREILYI
ncbi:hypothetical protein M422DRAFT_38196, partial [Sphaerobolus stellatus SS14]